MRTAVVGLVACFMAAGPDDEFQKRVRIADGQVRVDGHVIYEGEWKTAELRVRVLRLAKGVAPIKQVLLVADGKERFRVPVLSLLPPVAWPPLRQEEIKPLVRKLTETVGEKKTFTMYVVTEGEGLHQIYHGPLVQAKVERHVDSFAILLQGRVLYRVTRAILPKTRPTDVLARLNGYRESAGLGAVKLSPEFSKGCDLHALYMVKNLPKGLEGHEEDPDGIGYTREGARAGPRSVISTFSMGDSPVKGLESLMATLYHRVSILDPRLSRVGIGWAHRRGGQGQLVVDVGTLNLKPGPDRWPVLYPTPGEKEVPLAFGLGSRETPDPLPVDVKEAGYPITAQYPPGVATPHAPRAKLFAGGVEVPCWVTTPEKPSRKDHPQLGVICIIPKKKLRPGTKYVVRMTDRMTGKERQWGFTTAGREN